RSDRRCRSKSCLSCGFKHHSNWIITAILAGALMQPRLKHNIVGSRRSGTAATPIEDLVQSQSQIIQPSRLPDDRLTVANLGHATILMNFFGVRMISDPSLFKRVGLTLGPFLTVGPQRLAPAPLKPSQLQQLDVILVTHAHMDHLDIRSLEALPKSAV